MHINKNMALLNNKFLLFLKISFIQTEKYITDMKNIKTLAFHSPNLKQQLH